MKMTRRSFLASTAIGALAVMAPQALQAAEFKAAIVMPGNITDQAWNQTGFEAMNDAKEKLGIETAYSEKVPQPDQLEALSDYARRGYNVVIGHGGEFVDAVERAAQRFPDTMFVVTNGFVSGKNYASISFDFKHFGYVIGFLSAKMSKTGKFGYITGQKIQVATDLLDGYIAGIHSVTPDAPVAVAYTNDWDDIAKGKEAALNQLNQGIDVIFPLLDNAQIGALQACQEKKAWGFGVWQDVYENWKDTVLQSAVMDFRIAIVDFLRLAKEGKAEGKVYKFDIGTDAGRFGTYNPAIPKEIVEETNALIQKLKNGEVKI
ncbi:basic membrane protein A [Rhodoligotrophos appendicifer]|uniref:BMP family protein n=1 Tax=Rhodoligotrophos appendicifer TaxID=987056 RepID=UPI00117F7F71|nr:BMP family protein [Rhodoligotrophos appendicifer]